MTIIWRLQVQYWLQANNNTGILSSYTRLWYSINPNRICTCNLQMIVSLELNKGCGSKFHVGSRVQQAPEENWRTHQLKHCEYKHKDEDNSPKTLNDKRFSFILINSFYCKLIPSNYYLLLFLKKYISVYFFLNYFFLSKNYLNNLFYYLLCFT